VKTVSDKVVRHLLA